MPIPRPPHRCRARSSWAWVPAWCWAACSNGGSQYFTELLTGDQDTFNDQIQWGVDHPGVHQTEQFALVAGMLFLPLGFLGLAHLTRWSTPRLTAVATLLMLWGMWGFHNVVAQDARYISRKVTLSVAG